MHIQALPSRRFSDSVIFCLGIANRAKAQEGSNALRTGSNYGAGLDPFYCLERQYSVRQSKHDVLFVC